MFTKEIVTDILSGMLLGIPGTFGIFAIRSIIYAPFHNMRLTNEKNIDKLHKVKAKLKSSHDIMDFGENGSRFTGQRRCVYEYEVNGKKYKYKSITSGIVTDEINIYYAKKPKQAGTLNEVGYIDANKFVMYIIASVIAIIWLIVKE